MSTFNINTSLAPSPSASSLVSNNSLQVNEQNGTINYSVPLGSVKGTELEIPFSLDYHSSGLKLEEISSWVGLGWSLNGAYSISRTTIGDPDERGFINPTATIPNVTSGNILKHYKYFQNVTDQNNLDSEPDVFHFSLPGYSGEFYFDQQGGIHQLPQQDLKITTIRTSNELISFTITTPEGTQYTFGGNDINGIDAREISATNPKCDGVPVFGGVQQIHSSWMLTKVESYSGNDIIQFTYETNLVSYSQNVSETMYHNITTGENCNDIDDVLCVNNLNVTTKKLKEVIGEVTRLEVITDAEREDLSGGIRIAEIEFKDRNNIVEYRQVLTHDHLSSGESSPGPDDYRLILESVQQKGSGTSEIPKYSFNYYSGSVPNRINDKGQDHWGYYNGKSNSSLIPELQFGSFMIGSADREPSFVNTRIGVLNRVTLPTGGTSHIFYELNSYSNLPPTETVTENHCASAYADQSTGLVSTPFTIDNNVVPFSDLSIQMYFTGVSASCQIFSVYCRLRDSSGSIIQQWDGTNPPPNGQWTISDISPGNYVLEANTSCGNATASIIVDWTESYTINNPVEKAAGGLRVSRTYDRSNGTIFNDKTFNYDNFGETKSSGFLHRPPQYVSPQRVVIGTEMANGGGVPFCVTIAQCEYLKIVSGSTLPLFYHSGANVTYENITTTYPSYGRIESTYNSFADSGGNGFPFVPLMNNSWKRGLLLKKDEINTSDSIIRSMIYDYTFIENGEYGGTSGLTIAPLWRREGCTINFEYPNENLIAQEAWEFAPYVRQSKAALLTKVTSILDGVSTVENYTYDQSTYAHVQPLSKSILNSDNKTYSTHYKYANTYPTTSIRTQLLNNNRILPAWSSENRTNGTLVGGIQFDYKNFGGILYPGRYEQFEYGTDQSGSWEEEVDILSYRSDMNRPTEIQVTGWPDTKEYEWNSQGQLTTDTYVLHTMNYTYKPNQYLLNTSTAIDGQITDKEYDDLLRLISSKERFGDIETIYEYEYNPNIITTTQTYGSDVDITTEDYFDEIGRLEKSENILYADDGTTVSVLTMYNSRSKIASQTDQFGNDKEYTYKFDPLLRPATTKDQLDYMTSYNYGTNGLEVSGYSPNTLYRKTITDPDNRFVSQYTDKIGRIIMQRAGEGTNVADTYYKYDSKNRLIKIIPPDANSTDSNLTYCYTYDGDDNILTKKIPDKALCEYRYDDRNLQIGMRDGLIEANGKAWLVNRYDTYGRLERSGYGQESSDTLTINNQLIRNFYDGYGTGNPTDDIYRGRMDRSDINILDGFNRGAVNMVRTYTFDDFGRVSDMAIFNPVTSSETHEYTYDSADNILTVSHTAEGITAVKTNMYDSKSRMKSCILTVDNQTETVVNNIGYSKADEIVQRSIRGGFDVVNYTYNNNRWLTSIELPSMNYRVPDPCGSQSSTAASSSLFKMNLNYNALISGLNIIKRKNGTISGMTWDQAGHNNLKYGFAYDHLDRVTTANSGDSNAYGTSYSYADARGNIESIQRNGYVLDNNGCRTSQEIDDISITYNQGTNLIEDVTDGISVPSCPSFEHVPQPDETGIYGVKIRLTSDGPADPSKAIEFRSEDHIELNGGFQFDANSTGTFHAQILNCPNQIDNILTRGTGMYGLSIPSGINSNYDYDQNGNTGYDSSRDLNIKYNYLNKPYEVSRGLDKIEWLYAADGTKLQKKVTANGVSDIKNYYAEIEKSGNEYSVYHSDGRFYNSHTGDISWQYKVADHLGNTRVLYSDDNGDNQLEIVQSSHYYPFGMPMSGEWDHHESTDNEYLYNNKELNKDLGLDMMDYGARFYDPSIGRFSSIDKFTEKYAPMATFQYGANNPIKFIDINGDSLWIANNGDNILYENGQLFNSDGSNYEGKVRGFLKSVVKALDKLGKSKYGSNLISTLSESENSFTIKHTSGGSRFAPDIGGGRTAVLSNNAYALQVMDQGAKVIDFLPFNNIGSGGDIIWNPNQGGALVLGHEIGHAFDSNFGALDSREVDINGGREEIREIRAVYHENRIRQDLGKRHLRRNYSSGPRLLDSNNQPINYLPSLYLRFL